MIPLTGEVALVNLGMNDDDFNYLCTDTDFIIHAAAAVNLVYPYSVSYNLLNYRNTDFVLDFNIVSVLSIRS